MQTITFYSYKGGVGRSLALANIAKRLSEFNRKVCMIDFDLEAPGLPYKFSQLAPSKIQKGLVDYIFDFTNEGKLPENILDYSIKFPLSLNQNYAHLIPAGNTTASDYWKKLASINWYDLLYDNNGLSFFLDLKEKIRKEINPDFLLIDSRTGISEMSGITISLMADEVVVVAANNKENLTGARKIIHSISKPENSILGNVPRITFVLSRVPFNNLPEDRAKEQALTNRIKKEFLDIYKDDIVIIHSDRELEENERLKISSEFEDGFSEISKDYLKLFEKLTKDNLTEAEIERFNHIKEAERLFRLATNSKNLVEKTEFISRAIELNKTVEYYLFRANLFFTQNNYEKASLDYKEVIAIDKDNFEAKYYIVRIHIENHRYKDAIDLLDKLIALYPNTADLYFLKAITYSEIGTEEVREKILENYNRSLDLNPDSPIIYNNLANHYRLEKNFDKALELVYKSLELNPNQSIAFATLAEINGEMNNINEFYLNLELALLNKSSSLIKSISQEDIYKKFVNEERFNRLLEKYNLSLADLNLA